MQIGAGKWKIQGGLSTLKKKEKNKLSNGLDHMQN